MVHFLLPGTSFKYLISAPMLMLAGRDAVSVMIMKGTVALTATVDIVARSNVGNRAQSSLSTAHNKCITGQETQHTLSTSILLYVSIVTLR